MSISLNEFTSVPFRGLPPQYIGIKNCTPLAEKPGAVPVDIMWSDYVPGGFILTAIQIPINLNIGVRTPLQRIVSVYVDNSFNDYPVYLVFPDSNYGVSIGARTTQWYPVITNGTEVIFASEFIPDTVGKTRFIFSNIEIDAIDTSAIQSVSPEYLGTSFQLNPIVAPSDLIASRYRRSPSLGDMAWAEQFDLSTLGVITSNLLLVPDVTDPNLRTFIKEYRLDLIADTSLAMPTRVHIVSEFDANSNLGFYRGFQNSEMWIDSYQTKNLIHLNNLDIMSNGGIQITNIFNSVGVLLNVHIIFTYHLEDN